MNIHSVEDLDNALVSAREKEDDGLFEQGEAIVQGLQAGLSSDVVYNRFSYITRLSRRTGENRRKVWAILGQQRNPELSWQMHQLCCTAADIEDESTWEQARKWLTVASGEDSKGRGYTTCTLAEAMRANGLDPDKDKPVYLLDKVAGVINRVIDYPMIDSTGIILTFDGQLNIPENVEVIVTLVQTEKEPQALADDKEVQP